MKIKILFVVAVVIFTVAAFYSVRYKIDNDKRKKRCNEGESTQCYIYGAIKDSEMIPKNLLEKFISNNKEACAYYEKACAGGTSAGCGALARHYMNGSGVNKDNQKAVFYYDLACMKSSVVFSDYCTKLAKYYHDGNLLEKNNVFAVKYYDKACKEFKNSEACYILGGMYKDGELSSSNGEAAEYLNMSCDKHYKDSCEILEKVKSSVPPR